ncbi:MAG: alpha/beta fold hydrolase [Actinobacteria bacterium]|nr:alpha/beta fold hydrolase [Actinomycetota bacterium]
MIRKGLGVGRAPINFGIFKNREADWVFKRTLAYMSEKAAETGECLHVARKINERDAESWINEWAELAAKVEKQAEESLRSGCKVSAKESFLRASNYYRTAEYGCVPSHPRFHELWEKSVACFHKACPLFDPPVQIVEVPFKGKKLPGYFWHPDDTKAKRPTLMAVGGYDSSGEEIFFGTGMATIRRGYNYFTFEYPGHRGAVHLYPDCVKRPDYEVPFKAAIDYLETLPGVDERIALVGFSFGGYVVSRVAVYEDRLQAVIPDGPIVDVYQVQTAALRPFLKWMPASFANALLERRLHRAPLVNSLVKYGLWSAGYPDLPLLDWYKLPLARQFTIRDDLNKITCPALSLVGEGEGEELIRQAREFYEGISSEDKRLHIFTLEQDGSNDHVQLDNLSRAQQVAFDWLDEVFSYR